MVLGMGWVSFRCCYGGGRSHRYSSGSIAPRTASDLVEEKVQTIGMDMGEVLPKTRSSRRRVSSSPSLTAHLGGTADRLTVNWHWRLIGLLCLTSRTGFHGVVVALKLRYSLVGSFY